MGLLSDANVRKHTFVRLSAELFRRDTALKALVL